MTLILASRPNVYSSSPLDRIAARREDADWIAAQLARPRNPVRAGLALPQPNPQLNEGNPEAVYISGDMASVLRMQDGPWAFLGILDDRAVFAIDISATDDPVPLLPESLGTFVDLRSVGWGVPRPEASVLAHARGLIHWRQRHKFCGVCGNACEIKSAGHVMECTVCKTQHFPRTDPAVIMLVHRDGRALLGHSTRFPKATMYSTLAGFVEPGETLEEAVRREVLEESGIVSRRRALPLQPALAVPRQHHARLLRRGPDRGDHHRPGGTEGRPLVQPRRRSATASSIGFDLPRVDSIARRLIEDWLAAG